MNRQVQRLLAAMLLGTRLTAPASAYHLGFFGYGRESGAPEAPVPGDSLWIAGLVTDASLEPGLPFSPGDREYTVVIHNLVYWGIEQVPHGEFHHYLGGQLLVFADPSMDADWLAAPAGSDPPACFTNGELWLSAYVADLIWQQHYSTFFGMFEPDGGMAAPWFLGHKSCSAIKAHY